MNLKRLTPGALFILILLFFTPYALSQQEQNLGQTSWVKTGLGVEYLDLTMGWDEDEQSSKFRSYLFSTNTDISIVDGFSIRLIVGYSLSNFDGLVFRQLPFSIELGVKEIGGLLVGGQINKRLFNLSEYEINLYGQFVYYYGFDNEWEMPDLIVDGTILGTPSWMRAQFGTKIRYEGLIGVIPVFSAAYNLFWGNFTVDQDIQDIIGTEDKKIEGLSHLSISIGTEVEITPDFSVEGALSALPFVGGVDFNVVISFLYAFQSRNRRTP